MNERVIIRHVSIGHPDSEACVRKEEALENQLPYLAYRHRVPTSPEADMSTSMTFGTDVDQNILNTFIGGAKADVQLSRHNSKN